MQAPQCPKTVSSVRCILDEGHPGACRACDPVHYDVLQPAAWNRLESYKDAQDIHGYAMSLRDLCQDNVPLWGIVVLGHDPAPHFLDVRQEIDRYDKVSVCVARGHSKTTSYVKEEISHHLPFSTLESSEWHGWTALLIRESGTAAEKTIGAIKEVIEKNELVKMMFPALADVDQNGGKNTRRWTNEQVHIDLPGHSSDVPTLQGFGPLGSMTGDHVHDGYFDDVVSEKNSETSHQRNRIQSWFTQSMEGVLDEARERHLHTPYYENDLNAWLKQQGTYYVIQMPALQTPDGEKAEPTMADHIADIEYGPDGETVVDVTLTDRAYRELVPLWPCPEDPRSCPNTPARARRRHYERVGYHRSLRRLMYYFVKNKHAFDRQYMLNLRPGDAALVSEQMIRCFVWEGDTRAGQDCPWGDSKVISFPGWDSIIASVHGWDHAVGQEKQHDETAHAIAYRDHENRVFYNIDSDKWKSTKVPDMMENRFHADFNRTGIRPWWVVTEGINFQRTFGERLEEMGQAIIPVDVLKKASNKAVEFVECGLQAAMHQGRVYFHLDDDKSIKQFLNFTGEDGRTDDRVDAARIAYTQIREAMGRPWRVRGKKRSGSKRKRASRRRSRRGALGGGRGRGRRFR